MQPAGGVHQPPCPLPREEAHLPQLLRAEGEGVDDGKPHTLHQGIIGHITYLGIQLHFMYMHYV